MVDAQEAAFRGTFLARPAPKLESRRWKSPKTGDLRKTKNARHHALRTIESYAEGRANLQTPLTLVQHLIIDKGAHPWLEKQVFLNPFPAPLR